jgi:hypothetical protein
MRFVHRGLAVAAILTMAACSLSTDATSRQTALLAAAFSTVPTGFASTQNTFTGNAEGDFSPGPPGGPMAFGDRHGPGGGDHGMMGGGLGPDFFGGVGFGRGLGRGPFGDGGILPSTCTFVAATGRVTCPTETNNGLTINRWAKYTNAAGQVQTAFDTATTNTVQTHVDVNGTVTHTDRRDSTFKVTSTVQHASDRTVSGLATGSTQRTVNGTSAGSENSSGTNKNGAFTSSRVLGDTTSGLVIPLPTTTGTFPYPTAGAVIRHMKATITYAGKSAQTLERREVITYDGTTTAKLVITQDGVTTTCTLPLPRGRPSCS